VQIDQDAQQMLVWEKKGGWEVCCKEVLEKLLKNKRAWPFAEPVDPKALGLKDYKKVVKKPMDLGTVKGKLEQGAYEDLDKSGDEVYKDVMLTFENALLYNDEGDEIWELAGSLKSTFEELWAKLLEPVPHGDSGPASAAKAVAKPSGSAGASGGSSAKSAKEPTATDKDVTGVAALEDPNHKGGWECEICDDGGKLILCDKCGRGWHAKCLEVSDVKQLPDPWYCRECPGGPKFLWEQKGGWAVVCKEILDMLFKDKRVWPFERPVDPADLGLDDYFKIVKKPMDLGTIDKKLRAGDYSKDKICTEFYKEVSLVFDNAIKYNPKVVCAQALQCRLVAVARASTSCCCCRAPSFPTAPAPCTLADLASVNLTLQHASARHSHERKGYACACGT